MAGFSIPASEHSTVSMWGREAERAMFENYVRTFLIERKVPAGVPKLAACVSDTFDVFRACEAWSTEPLKSLIQGSGGTLVIRPDSGDPLDVLPRVFEILAANLAGEIRENSKGFRVLPSYLRVIQGDGIDLQSMERILRRLTELNWSASNIALFQTFMA
jgi:nicotinamide phosphoribosyltransferase